MQWNLQSEVQELREKVKWYESEEKRDVTPDPRQIEEMGTKSKDIKERLEVAERNHDASFE